MTKEGGELGVSTDEILSELTPLPEHVYHPNSWSCSCGWTAPLGSSGAREFDKHLLSLR